MKNKKWVGACILGILAGITAIAILANAIFSSGCTYQVAKAAEYSELFEIKFNPTGTHIQDGQLYIRLDYYPTEAAQSYTEQHFYDDNKDSPTFGQWVTNPALCQFVKISDTTTEQELLNYIDSVMTPAVLATLDNALIQSNSAHLVSPLLKDKCTVSIKNIRSPPPDLIDTINSRFFTLTVSGSASSHPGTVLHQSIDVGSTASDRAANVAITYTLIAEENPANANGTIDTVEMWFDTPGADVEVGTQEEVAGDTFTTRDNSGNLGNIASGSKQTASGLSIDVQAGDYASIHGSGGDLERDNSGTGWWYKSGDYIPCNNEAFTHGADRTISLYMTGTESGGGTAPTVGTDTATAITCNSVNGTGNVTAIGSANVTYWGIQYGIGDYSNNVSDTGNQGAPFDFSLAITALTPSTEYQSRAFAQNSVNISFGSSVNFTTSASASPTVTTNAATNILYESAQLNATLSNLTCANATDILFEWGTSTGNYTSNWTDSGSWGNVSFDRTPTLTSNTTYYYRGGAALSGGAWQYGAEQSFATLTYGTPTVVTGNATSISYTSATGQGNITGTGNTTITERGFQYGIGGFTDNTSEAGTFSTGNFSLPITSLSNGTEYQYRAFIYSANLSAYYYGSSVNFTTLAYTVPTVVTGNATSVSYTTATGQGNITGVDGANATERGFQYGIGAFTDNVSEAGTFSTGNYSLGLSSLADNTEYMIRAYAINIAGIGYGASVNFTTLDIVAPTVATINATSITSTTATLSGNVTNTGGPNYNTRFVEWGTSSGNYTANSTTSGSYTTGVFNIGVTSLSANTTYYWRPGAINTGNVGYGTEESFTTSAAPPSVPDAPTGFTLTDQGGIVILGEWNASTNATGYLVLVSRTGFPSSTTGYEIAYNGTATTANFTGYNLDGTTYYFSLWAYNANGYSTDYATASIGGDAMIYLALGLLALGLTVGMFVSKQAMLGFPSVIFWAILGSYAYTQFTTAWVDWEFYLAISCFLGMVPFSAIAGYGLRTKKEDVREGTEYIDEGGEQETFIDERVGREDDGEGSGNRRAREIQGRAEKRRKAGTKPKTDYGEFR